MALEIISGILSTTLTKIGDALSMPKCQYFDACTSRQYGCEGTTYDERVCSEAENFRLNDLKQKALSEQENPSKI